MSLKFSPFCRAVKFETVPDFVYGIQRTNRVHRDALPKVAILPISSGRSALAASSELAFEQFIGQLRLLEHDQTIRHFGDVCGARNTQFEQEFLGLFRVETVSAYDWRDRIGDFCVADYLAELDMVHVVRYSTRFSLHVRAHGLMPSQPVITTARECSPPP